MIGYKIILQLYHNNIIDDCDIIPYGSMATV